MKRERFTQIMRCVSCGRCDHRQFAVVVYLDGYAYQVESGAPRRHRCPGADAQDGSSDLSLALAISLSFFVPCLQNFWRHVAATVEQTMKLVDESQPLRALNRLARRCSWKLRPTRRWPPK